MAKNPEEVLVAAKAAHKADKKNKELKAAYKAAQVAAAAWKEEQVAAEAKAAKKAAKKAKKEKKVAVEAPVEPEKKKKNKKRKAEEAAAEPEVKKPKVDAESLKAAAAAAKAAHKASPSDEALKAAYKAARKAAKNFTPETEAEVAAPAPVETPAAEEDDISSLKKKPAADGWDKPATSVPSNATEKLFLGNLSWDIDDESITEFFKECGTLTDIFWLTDKESGSFKGCGFVTFEDTEQSAKAYLKSGEEVMGREIKIEFANPRPGGDRKSGGKGKGKGGKGGGGSRPLSDKPEDCTTVFAGNLSFDIDDDGMRDFAKDCGEVKSIRWVTDRDSGDFKGCGFVEFYDSSGVDKFVKKNGEDLLGRSIRLDYANSR